MNKSNLASAALSSACAVVLLLACGGGSKPPEEPHGEVLPLTEAPASSARPAPTAEPTHAASAAASAPAPAASSAEPEKKPRPSGGAPMAVTEDDTEVTTTYGARGGKIRIAGAAELIVPTEAIDVGTNFTLGKNVGRNQLKIPPYKGQMGDVYRIGASRPDSAPNTSIQSSGAPFVLKLPLPKGKETGNLVVAVPAGENHGKYVVVAPKSVEDGPNGKVAVFELPRIVQQGMIHLTSSPPTGGE